MSNWYNFAGVFFGAAFVLLFSGMIGPAAGFASISIMCWYMGHVS